MTPFEEFHLKVRDLMDGDVAQNLGAWCRDHPIYGPLEQLYDATHSVRVTYGREGPDTSWNRPIRKSRSDFGGSNHSNSSRPSTPIRNNAGLHPNWPNTPPPSRPGSWSGLNQIKQLEAENHNLLLKLDNYKEELRLAKEECRSLAAANRRILELEAQILQQGSAMERTRLGAATAYIQLKRYGSAASEYEQLALLKKDEKKLRVNVNDEEGKRKAEDDELFYMFEQARALANEERYEHAERVLRSVRSLKEQLGSRRVAAVNVHGVQSQLCDALIRQGKTSEARKLYLDAAAPLELGTLNTSSPADCTWALQNAMSYTRLLTKERDYDQARYWMKRIWPSRHRATAEGLHAIEKETMDIADILQSRGQSKQQMKLLETICSNNVAPLTTPLLYCYANLGILYHNCANSNDDFANSAAYLRQAWTNRQCLNNTFSRRTGWTLALTLVRLKIFQDARDILRELQPTNITAASGELPTNDQVQALLAHTQLMQQDFTAAETTAAKVYKRVVTKDVFAGSSSSPIDLSAFHHADTLIRARVKQNSREKFREARAVWEAIYKARQGILGTDKSGKAQLSRHVASGKVLADEWKKFAESMPAKPVSAREVRTEADAMEAMLR